MMQAHSIELKEKDYKNYIACLFIPPEVREIISTIFLFDNEISEIYFKTSNPLARNVRYQWWYEALDELSANKPTKSPLLEKIKLYKIDTETLKHIVSLHEAIAEAGFLPDQEAIDELFSHFSNTLEIIAEFTDQKIKHFLIREIYRISYMSKLLLHYFDYLDGNHLKPFSQIAIEKFAYNPDFIKDEDNHKKLSLAAKQMHNELIAQLEIIEAKLPKPSTFLKAYIYNIKYQLRLLKKQKFDLKKRLYSSKLPYLLGVLWNT